MKNKPPARTRRYACEVHHLSWERWPDFERLFGERGACGGCWCMFWRQTRAEFEAGKGAGNKRAMKALVRSGQVPGLLAYIDGEPVGWCALAPRQEYAALARSRVLRPVDDQPVWSVVCFFVARGHRNQGLTVRLLKAALQHVKRQGGRILEGYPVAPKKDRIADPFAYTGLESAFRKAGFRECARRSETRPVMRRRLR
jgi:GNAT superfamily N-acetyltransferase